MHSNGTLPLLLLLPLDAPLDVDADARCVHSLKYQIRYARSNIVIVTPVDPIANGSFKLC